MSKKLFNVIKDIAWGKATGLDKIQRRLLKIAADVVAPSLTCIFNQSLLSGIYPSDWKLAKVSPIFKNGSKSDVYKQLSAHTCYTFCGQNFRKDDLIPTIQLSE